MIATPFFSTLCFQLSSLFFYNSFKTKFSPILLAILIEETRLYYIFRKAIGHEQTMEYESFPTLVFSKLVSIPLSLFTLVTSNPAFPTLFFAQQMLVDTLHRNIFPTQDTFILETPGGGGYGPPGEKAASAREKPRGFVERGSVFEYRKAQESV